MKSRPETLRWWILLLFSAMTVNFLDRQVLSLVAPVLRDDLHLSNTEYGTIVFCFLLGMTLGQIPARTALSDRISAELRGRGFSFVGSTIVYAHMQATGMVNDHLVSCFRHRQVQNETR